MVKSSHPHGFFMQALLAVLRESHRSRTVFRRVGGFVYVTSLLVAMERLLGAGTRVESEPNGPLELLRAVFHTLTAAMRYEPANAHFFRTEVQYEKLADAVRLLGCFSDAKKLAPVTTLSCNTMASNTQAFQRLLEDEAASEESVCPQLAYCAKLFVYLYKMATDSFDR